MSSEQNIYWKIRHLKTIIYLINRINKEHRLYIMVRFLYIVHEISKIKRLVPLVWKNYDFWKRSLYFLKTILWKKCHLFNKLNKQIFYILHDRTFLYIALAIGVSNILVLLFFKSHFLWKIMLFLKKHDFLSNYVCLLNQLNKVCTFLYNQTFKYILHTILNIKTLVPLILEITTSKNITLFVQKHDLKK